MRKKIKLFDPVIGDERIEVEKVLESKFWASGAGNGNVEIFEKEFKKFIGAKECVAVNSGTAALHLALLMADIKNKEVIVPSLSFVSTANAILYNGGTPIFVDINPSTLNLDPEMIIKKISKKTAAILPVHFGGLPVELKKIKKIAKDFNLKIIDDAAHACGAKFEKKFIGTQNFMTCFSFHPVKNLAMPTGGLISINSKDSKKIKRELNSLRWCGITNRKDVNYDVEQLGWNYYMNEFSAVIGLSQLKKLEKLNKHRQKIAKKYHEGIELSTKMPITENSVYHFYWILVKNRDVFRKKLLSRGIETGIHYKPIHTMKLYKNKIKLKNTEYVGNHIVSLPTHPNLLDSDIEFIIKEVNKEL